MSATTTTDNGTLAWYDVGNVTWPTMAGDVDFRPWTTLRDRSPGSPGLQPEVQGGTEAEMATTATTQPRWALLGLVVIPTWILFGNLLVLMAVVLNRNLRTLSNYVIASLAATDFMLALTVVPLGTYQVVSITFFPISFICIQA